ncbi:hypothetical protein GCM10018791_53380 [Streptomyces zaomyceticus]|nr:hypothetical protein GCM10018791_53380 [Streptomyces zaomyceticus]
MRASEAAAQARAEATSPSVRDEERVQYLDTPEAAARSGGTDVGLASRTS